MSARWVLIRLTIALTVLVSMGCAAQRAHVAPQMPASPERAPATQEPQPSYIVACTLTPWPTYTFYPTYTPAPLPTCDCPTCTPLPVPSATATPERRTATLLAVTDGDTIVITLDGHEERVRYLAIDCPELDRADHAVNWLADEATRANTQLLGSQTIWIRADTPERDVLGRLLCWVWAGDTLVNAELVRLGYAHLGISAESSRYAGLLHAAEHEAQQAARGLWGPTPTTTPRPTQVPSPTPSSTPGPCLYIGNANSMILHRADCSSVARMSESNRVCFSSRDDALAQGYRPCKVCNP